MTRLEDRQTLLETIHEAQAAGARLEPACALAGTRSHAQRPLGREHGEDGEHWTFPVVSTMAGSAPVDEPCAGADTLAQTSVE